MLTDSADSKLGVLPTETRIGTTARLTSTEIMINGPKLEGGEIFSISCPLAMLPSEISM